MRLSETTAATSMLVAAASPMHSAAEFTAVLAAERSDAGQSDAVQSGALLHSQAGANSPIDFTRATRQEVFDWMNREIRGGRMTLDESTPFLGMTLKMDAATFRPIDMATDQTRTNYIQKAQAGIEWAQQHGDNATAERLQTAMRIMHRTLLHPSGIDAVA